MARKTFFAPKEILLPLNALIWERITIMMPAKIKTSTLSKIARYSPLLSLYNPQTMFLTTFSNSER
ncbi:MAG: hypothetical protein ACTSRI_00415 [Promethearchaeota archaeon]